MDSKQRKRKTNPNGNVGGGLNPLWEIRVALPHTCAIKSSVISFPAAFPAFREFQDATRLIIQHLPSRLIPENGCQQNRTRSGLLSQLFGTSFSKAVNPLWGEARYDFAVFQRGAVMEKKIHTVCKNFMRVSFWQTEKVGPAPSGQVITWGLHLASNQDGVRGGRDPGHASLRLQKDHSSSWNLGDALFAKPRRPGSVLMATGRGVFARDRRMCIRNLGERSPRSRFFEKPAFGPLRG